MQRSGTFGFELPLGEVQKERQSNVVPLGEVGVGVFQHRALLFKVSHSLVPRPPPSFPSLAVRKSGRRPGTFPHVSDVTDRANYVNVGDM